MYFVSLYSKQYEFVSDLSLGNKYDLGSYCLIPMVKVFWRAFEHMQQTQLADDIPEHYYWQDKGLKIYEPRHVIF